MQNLLPVQKATAAAPLKTEQVDSTQVDDLFKASKSMGLTAEQMRQLEYKKRILDEAEKL